MAIAPIQAASANISAANQAVQAGALQLGQSLAQGGTAASQAPFQQLLGDAIDKTRQLQNHADFKTTGLLTGEVEDLHEVMIAMQKADLAFQLTMQVRNKVVEAYQEIMRMQI